MTMILQAQGIAAVNAKSWDGWMAQQNAAHFQQYFGYGAALSGARSKAVFLEFKTSGAVAARGLMLSQSIGPLTLSYLPRGLVFAPGADARQVYAVLKGQANIWRGRVTFFAPSCRSHEAYVGIAPIITGDSEAVLSLGGSPQSLRGGLQQKWRNRLNKAERCGVDVKQVAAASPGAQWLAREEASQRKTKRYRSLDSDLPDKLAKQDGKLRALYFLAQHKNETVAGASFILDGVHATYFGGVTLNQGRGVSAQHGVLMHAALHLQRLGYKTLNLGGVDTHKAPGLARFKLGMGSKIEPHSGTFLHV